MRFGTYKVNSWVEDATIVFECPVCEAVDKMRVRVEVTHSPAKCRVCGKKFQVEVTATVIPE